MGNCSKRDVNLSRNSVNDHHFLTIPTLPKNLSDLDISELKHCLKLVTKKKLELYAKSASIVNFAEINVEIQEFANLSGKWFAVFAPFVRVSLEPSGPFYETFHANKDNLF